MTAVSHSVTHPITHLWGILLEPARSWRDLQERSGAVWPFLIMIALMCASIYFYYSKVDFDWLILQMQAGMGDVTAEQRQAMADAMSKSMMMWGGVIGAPIFHAVVLAIVALYYHLVTKTMGYERKYGQWFAFCVWTTWPLVLSSVIALVMIFSATTGEIAMNVMQATSLGYLLNVPAESPWNGLLGALSLLMVWQVVIGTIGLQVWTKAKTSTAAIIVLAPSVVIFGAWALWIALK